MKVIVLEGIDGSGKSGLAAKVAAELRSYGLRAEYVHFPNIDIESSMGNRIYDYLDGKYGDFADHSFAAQWMLYALDRYEWFQANKKKYENSILICDRYTTSSMIYQGANMYLQFLKRCKNYEYCNSNIFSKLSLLECYENGGYHQFRNAVPDDELTDEIIVDLGKFTKTYGDIKKFIEDIAHYEYDRLEIPKPDITFFITGSTNEFLNRIDNADRRNTDTFESNSTLLECADKLGNIITSQNGTYGNPIYRWKRIHNREGELNSALRSIIKCLEEIPFSFKYNEAYKAPDIVDEKSIEGD